MRLTKIFFIGFLLSISITSQVKFENGLISFKYEYEPLRSVLKDIKSVTGMNFVYSDNLVKNYRVSCLTTKTALHEAIKKVLSLPNLAYKKFKGNTYVLFRKIERSKRISLTTSAKNEDRADVDSAIVLKKPEIISRSNPFYPSEAIKGNIEGKVVMKLLINKQGEVIKTMIENSSGYSILDVAATAYSQELKFSPALMNNKPIDIWLSMVFNYKLE